MSRKEVGGGLACFEDSDNTPIRRHDDYVKKNKESLITVIRNPSGNLKIKRTTITRKQKMGRKHIF